MIPAKSDERFQSRGHLFIVADGMGAHAAGELASSMATELIAMNYFRPLYDDPQESLHVAVGEANAEIHQRGQQNPEFHNMGTTASALTLLPQGAVVAHVGDSRIYRLRDGVLEQLTFDHSLVWEVQASGQVHPDSALGQALPKNVITRSLGPNADVQIDMEGPFEIKRGDRFLLCSDGLSGQVEDVEIATLLDCLPEQLAVQVLVDLANLRGGPDNTTVIITTVSDDELFDHEPSARPKPPKDLEHYRASVLLAAIAGLCLIAAMIFWYYSITGPMVIVLILALIAGTTGAASYMERSKRPRRSPSSAESSGRVTKACGGKGPYRRYLSKPDRSLFERLGNTVQELRDAAAQKNWLMDWKEIDQLQHQGEDSMVAGDGKQAIRFQAEAIVETMNQLREQHDRSANETAIDQ